jgi:hypothetical protein
MSVTGSARSDVAAVTVASENDGKRKSAAAVVARPDQSILEHLRRAEPLVVFHSVFRGCVPPHKTVATALDASGAELGRERGLRVPRKHFHPACRAESAKEEVTLGYNVDWLWGFAYDFF